MVKGGEHGPGETSKIEVMLNRGVIDRMWKVKSMGNLVNSVQQLCYIPSRCAENRVAEEAFQYPIQKNFKR